MSTNSTIANEFTIVCSKNSNETCEQEILPIHLQQLYQQHVLMILLENLSTDDILSLMLVTKRFFRMISTQGAGFWRKRYIEMRNGRGRKKGAKKGGQSYFQACLLIFGAHQRLLKKNQSLILLQHFEHLVRRRTIAILKENKIESNCLHHNISFHVEADQSNTVFVVDCSCGLNLNVAGKEFETEFSISHSLPQVSHMRRYWKVRSRYRYRRIKKVSLLDVERASHLFIQFKYMPIRTKSRHDTYRTDRELVQHVVLPLHSRYQTTTPGNTAIYRAHEKRVEQLREMCVDDEGFEGELFDTREFLDRVCGAGAPRTRVWLE